MKIYTKIGDKGTTSLFGGRRVHKSDLRIEAYGTVDELNSFVGLLADQEANKERLPFLREIQERLFTVGSSLAADPEKETLIKPELLPEDLQKIEDAIDEMDEMLPPLKNFILPGGHNTVSFAHIARVVCRRAERNVVSLSVDAPVEEIVIQYLNRLSDYFFTLSRKLSQELHAEEIPWTPRANKF